MADTLLSEQQVKQLIDTGNLDLSEALKLMPQTAYNLLANDLTQAIQTGDMQKINSLITTARSQISPDVYNKLQNTTQKTAYTFQVLKQVQHYQKVTEKKEKGLPLTANDNSWLNFKDKLEQQIKKVEGYYPQAFTDNQQSTEPTPMELDSVFLQDADNKNTQNVFGREEQSYTGTETADLTSFQVHQDNAYQSMENTTVQKDDYASSDTVQVNREPISAIRTHFSDEMQSYTTNEGVDGAQFQSMQQAQSGQLAENTTIQNNSQNTDVFYSEFVPNHSENPYHLPQNQTTNTAEGSSQYIDMYEPSLNPDGLPHTMRSGNTYEMTAEAMKERNALNSLQSVPKSVDETNIQNMNDAIARNNMETGGGFINDFKLADEDKRSTDWSNVWQNVGKHLQTGGEKNLDDFCMKMVTGSLLAGVEFLTQWANEQVKNMKEDAKTARQKRLDYIDSNLKNKGLTMTSLASKLAHDSKLWVLNDPAYATLPKTGPYNAQQKELLKKQEFAAKLPRTNNGDIDYAKLSGGQKKQLHSYIEDYAKTGQWKSFVYETTGIALQTSEMKKMTNDAKEMHVRVDVSELSRPLSVNESTVMPTMPLPPQRNNENNISTSSSVEAQVAPVTALSPEEIKLRQEAQSAIKMDKLDDLNVSGTLKQPKVLRLSDGTTFDVTNATMEDLKRKEEEIKRKKEANDDMRNKNREQQRILSNVRSGKETTVQAPTQTRQAGMGGRS